MYISSSCNFVVYHSPDSKLDLFGTMPEDRPLNGNESQLLHIVLLMIQTAKLGSARTGVKWATDVASVLAE